MKFATYNVNGIGARLPRLLDWLAEAKPDAVALQEIKTETARFPVEALKDAGKSYEFFRYDADHAFVNEQRAAVHDREAAELAWGRATDFFKIPNNRVVELGTQLVI